MGGASSQRGAEKAFEGAGLILHGVASARYVFRGAADCRFVRSNRIGVRVRERAVMLVDCRTGMFVGAKWSS